MEFEKYIPDHALELKSFAEMDYFAVQEYGLPIELMMENAGLHLARLVAHFSNQNQHIVIGAGNGNNGGGGLVAARRLAAWGYEVFLDLPVEITKDLPILQLERALKFGARKEIPSHVDVWVDAYLGFSQRLPLSAEYQASIEQAIKSEAVLISLDLPTGIAAGDFIPDHVLTLAAYKKTLELLPDKTKIFIADLGIPSEVYNKFGIEIPPFKRSSILQVQ